MDETQHYFKSLLDKYLSGDISPREVEELFDFIASGSESANRLLSFDNQKAFQQKLNQSIALPEETSARMHKLLLEKIAPVHQLPARAKIHYWPRAVAAASVLLILAVGSYFFFNTKTATSKRDTAAIQKLEVEAPKSSRATITLANGAKIFLDSLNNGTMALEGNAQLVKLANGEIAYKAIAGQPAGEMAYNTLENPRGSTTIDMTFADGTRVWLNAGSSITYPVAFIGGERRVSVNGEVYLEVAHDAKKPFYVVKNDMNVQVLGTHFNVQAYDNEKNIQVTLLEGAVKILKGSNGTMLKPGEQAEIDSDVKINRRVDIQQVMAWKNGVFRFNRTPLDAVMRQVERWYGVEVFYENGVPSIQLGGEIKRDLSLLQLLEGLGELGVKFEITEKRLYVKQ